MSNGSESTNSEEMLKQDTEHSQRFYLNKEIVIAHKHQYHGNWSSSEEEEFRKVEFLL